MADKLGPYELNSIITGDARELSKAIPDNSVDLIFTDPVYDRIEDYEWLAETAARVLKDDRACLVWCGVENIGPIINSMTLWLDYKWILVFYRPAIRMMYGPILHRWLPILWFVKGHMWAQVRDVFLDRPRPKNINHQWSKAIDILTYYLQYFTSEDQIVFDPFTGGGTVPAVCKMLNRQYLAFEIDPETADLARQRVLNTQPPLPLIYHEQTLLLAREAKK